jgi:lipopolysaccharide/colanic/teichoic acid biosynthesis glycosyltransferase
MSVIGPRPEILSITSEYSVFQKKVFKYKPGVTGISQVNGRQMLTPEERVNMEIEYYDKATFWSDLKIILATVKVIISNKGNV